MNDFTTWFAEMKTNIFWWQRTQEMYGKKDLNKVASEVHLYLMAGGSLDNEDWPGWRKLFQTFARRSDDITTISLQQGIIEKPKEDWKPVSWEERAKRLEEFQAMIDNSPMMKPVAPLTAKEKIENQGWRPKPEEVKEPSEVEKRSAYIKHLQRVRQSRSLLFLEAYPNAEPEEIEAYLKKFECIDNPLGLEI